MAIKSVTLDKRIYAPGSTVRVTWTFSENATDVSAQVRYFKVAIHNPLTGKTINVSSNLSKETRTASIKLKDNQDLPQRGNQFNVSVWEINYSGLEFGAVYSDFAYVNVIPPTPNFETRLDCVPSSGTGRVDTRCIVSDIDSLGQKYELYYAIGSSGGQKNLADFQFTGPITIPSGQDQISYFFWLKNQEFSSTPYEMIFYRNTPPKVVLGIEVKNGETILTATPVDGTGFDGGRTLHYNFGYTVTSDVITHQEVQPETSGGASVSLNDIRSLIAKTPELALTPARTYGVKFWVERNDSLETYRASSVHNIITPEIYFGNKGPVEYFYDGLKLVIGRTPNNDLDRMGVPWRNVEMGYGLLNGQSAAQVDEADANHILVNFSDVEKNKDGETFSIIKMTPANKSPFYIKASNYAIKTFTFSIIPQAYTPRKFNPYTDASFSLTIKGGGERALEYGFKLSEVAPQLTLTYSGQSLTASTIDYAEYDTYTYIFTGSEIYNAFFKEKTERPGEISLGLSMTSSLGQTYSGTMDLALLFSYSPIISQAPQYVMDDGTSCFDYSYLKSGAEIYVTTKILAFYPPTLSFYNENTTGALTDTLPWSSYTFSSDDGKESEEFHGFNAQPYEYTLSTPYKILTIPETTKTYSLSPTMQVTCRGGNDKAPSNVSIKVEGQWLPEVVIESASIVGNDLKCQYQIGDWGYDSKYKNVNNIVSLTLWYGDSSEVVSSYSENELVVLNFADKIAGESYARLGLQIETKFYALAPNGVDELWATSKESLKPINFYILYNIVPTVSYRPNHLGINTANFEEDSLIEISGYNDQRYIIIRGVDNQGREHCLQLDAQSGNGTGFILDCGSWDTRSSS